MRSTSTLLQKLPRTRPVPIPPYRRPYPKSPPWSVFFARKTSLTLIAPLASDARPQPSSTASSGRERSTAEKPSFRSVQWPRVSAVVLWSSRAGMRDDEDGGHEERAGIDPVRGVRPRGGGEQAAEHRADRPARVLDRLQERVRVPELRLRYEVRHARIDRRTEEAGRETGDEREPDDLARARRERKRREDDGAQHVGGDHQLAAFEPVEQRAEREPDEDRRQDLDDEHGAHPEPRVRAVLDVDRERDRSQERPDARAERREEEEPESGKAERSQLPRRGTANHSAAG